MTHASGRIVRRFGLAAPLLAVAGVVLAFWGGSARTLAQEESRPLPAPRLEAGRPLMRVLKDRQTTREFLTNALPAQALSELLWAGFGVNRPATDHRTAPSAMNSQEIDVYVATPEGVFLYEAKGHQLRRVLSKDVRGLTGGGAFAPVAPVTLIFVADYARMTKARPEQKELYAGMDAAFVSQNVYLYCASEGLGTVVHDLDRAPLARQLPLRPEQRIVLAQAVGLPAAPKEAQPGR